MGCGTSFFTVKKSKKLRPSENKGEKYELITFSLLALI